MTEDSNTSIVAALPDIRGRGRFSLETISSQADGPGQSPEPIPDDDQASVSSHHSEASSVASSAHGCAVAPRAGSSARSSASQASRGSSSSVAHQGRMGRSPSRALRASSSSAPRCSFESTRSQGSIALSGPGPTI